MGIKFLCPNGHKLHVKSFLASQRGVCPHCGEKFIVPAQSLPELRVESIGVKGGRRGGAAEFEDAATLTDTKSRSAAVVAAVRNGEVAAATRSAVASAAPTDPLVEAPAAVWYVRIANGNQFGPAPADMMRRWLDEGRVATDSLVWREGWAEWAVAGKLFPQLNQPIVPPVGAGVGDIAAFEQGLAEHVETLVAPADAISNSDPAQIVTTESRPIKHTTLDKRRKANQRSKLALIALVVAIVCLLPVFLYVVFMQ